MSDSNNKKVVATEDHKKLRKHFRDRVEHLKDEIDKLAALDFLLSGYHDEQINKLSWLVSPVVENLTAIQEELSQFFYNSESALSFLAQNDNDLQGDGHD
ncbi:hypothetical protein [Methylomonas sp. MgM2]